MNYPKRGSHPTKSTSDDENSDNALTVMKVAAVATGVAAVLTWGISRLLGNSEPEPKPHEKMMLSSSSSSSSSSSRGMRDQNRNDNNNTYGHLILEAKRMNSGNGKEKWTRPKEGRFKLNTDASVRKKHGAKTGPATAGGVIRNDAGQWIAGFTSKLGVCDSTHAELEAIRDGLCLAWELGYRWLDLEVETDSEAAVILIKKTDSKFSDSMRLVVEECRDLLTRFGSEIGHVYKEGNKCAHALAKIEIPHDDQLVVWEDEPNYKHVRDVVANEMKHSLSAHYVLG